MTIGAGSTATATFDGLELGTYRAYEVADDAFSVYGGQPEEDKGAGNPINGYQWEVTQTGTYYVLDDATTPATLKMVDGDGTHARADGDWGEGDKTIASGMLV